MRTPLSTPIYSVVILREAICEITEGDGTESTLAGSILGIVLRRPKEQMRNANARPVIAAVEDKESGRNRPVLKLPSHSMCELALALKPHHSVPATLQPADHHPAFP